MANDYSRKQNTDNYQTTIERRTNEGEELLRAVRATIRGFDDLVERNTNTETWLKENRATVGRIYTDGGIAEPFLAVTGIDLGGISHQDIYEQLDAIVSGQITALRELTEKTRAWDEREMAPA